MVRILAIISITSGAGMVAATYASNGQFWIGILFGGLLILWYFAFFRKWLWVQDISMVLFLCGIAPGLLLGYSTVIFITAAFLLFIGWDLAAFSIRLESATAATNKILLIKHHILRLAFCSVVGVGLTILVFNIHIKLAFGWMLLISLFVALGLGRLVNRLLSR